MKDMWFRVRIWIAWHAMPKDTRPIFVKALGLFADELLKKTRSDEGEAMAAGESCTGATEGGAVRDYRLPRIPAQAAQKYFDIGKKVGESEGFAKGYKEAWREAIQDAKDVLQHIQEGEKDSERNLCDPEKNPSRTRDERWQQARVAPVQPKEEP